MPLTSFQKTRKKKKVNHDSAMGFVLWGHFFFIIKSIFVIGGNIDNFWFFFFFLGGGGGGGGGIDSLQVAGRQSDGNQTSIIKMREVPLSTLDVYTRKPRKKTQKPTRNPTPFCLYHG
jgi:hypothetical protein